MGSPKYPKLGGFELVKQIGGGGFSVVFHAVNVEKHEVAACKLVAFTDETTQQMRKSLEKEMKVHAALHHEYVLRFINAIVVEMKHKDRYVPGIYMLMELAAGGDLFDKIVPDVGVGEEVARFYFNQLVEGMNYIHSQGVCHRDLKPENLLLDAAGTLKISDFGLSAVYKLKETGQTRLLSERCGSLPYVAPELNEEGQYEAEPIDLWGMGVILFALLAGNTPWDEPTIRSPEFASYVKGESFDELPWARFGEELTTLLRGLLCLDPKERWTIEDIAQCSWLTRPSQIQGRGTAFLAEKLTEGLHQSGDIAIAAPHLDDNEMDVDADGDQVMLSASRNTQFTQTLMLFSQTQSGVRYNPHLTRFYASLAPPLLLTLIQEGLVALNVQTKLRPAITEGEVPWLRIGGYDRRKIKFKGWVTLENFSYRGMEGSFCVMQRDEGNPISWRQLWKALIMSPGVEPHVLRKSN